MLRIAVGSTSQLKLEAVRTACSLLNLEAAVQGFACASQVNEQPLGFAETTLGAQNRANAAFRWDPHCDLAFGLESGLLRTSGLSLDITVIACLLSTGDWAYAITPGIQLPERFVRETERLGFDRHTVASVIAAHQGGSRQDPHATLSGGRLNRSHALVDGLITAFRMIEPGHLEL